MSVNNYNYRQSFITGTTWMVGLRWAMKGIGLVSTVILARLVTPADFGLIAMAVMAAGFIEIWLAFGVDTALIQNKSADRDDYDTAWTLKILQGAFVGLLLILIAPFTAIYFKEPRIVELIWIIAFCSALSGTNNIGIVNFRKEMHFHREFLYNLISKLVSFVVTIVLAFWLRNYWAMIAGIAANYIAAWVLSYTMQPYRPRITLRKISTLWNFSKWMLVVNAGIYISGRIDEMIAARLGTPFSYGIYNVSSDLGQMPTNELSLPVSRVMIPLLSNLQDEKERLWEVYLKTMAGVNTLTLPAGVGMAFVAPQLVPIFLGQKWLEAVPFIQVFALYGALRFIYSGAYNVLTAQGLIKTQSKMLWLEIVLLVGLCIPGGLWFGLIGVAEARLAVAILMGAATLRLIYALSGISPLIFFLRLVRPGLATAVMAAVLWHIPIMFGALPFIDLLARVAIGASSYVVALLMLWRLAGKPDGAEHIFAAYFNRIIRRQS